MYNFDYLENATKREWDIFSVKFALGIIVIMILVELIESGIL